MNPSYSAFASWSCFCGFIFIIILGSNVNNHHFFSVSKRPLILTINITISEKQPIYTCAEPLQFIAMLTQIPNGQSSDFLRQDSKWNLRNIFQCKQSRTSFPRVIYSIACTVIAGSCQPALGLVRINF